MVIIGKTVPYGNTGVFSQILNHLMFKASVLDTVIEAAKYLSGILKGLLLSHLGVCQERDAGAFIICGDFK